MNACTGKGMLSGQRECFKGGEIAVYRIKDKWNLREQKIVLEMSRICDRSIALQRLV